MQYVQTSWFFNCANLAVCFVCPASFFSSWMCVCVGVVVVTFLSVAPPVSPPSSGHTPAAHQWLGSLLKAERNTQWLPDHCQLKCALGLCLVWVLCGGGVSLAGITLLSVSTLPWSLTSLSPFLCVCSGKLQCLSAAVRTQMPHHCFYLEKPCQ